MAAAAARPHPAHPHRLVLVPERTHQVFVNRRPGERVTPEQLRAMGYPLYQWQKADPTDLEERVAWELSHAPHADVLVGIPAQLQSSSHG